MRKIFTLLCLLCLTMATKAQVHVTETGTNTLNAATIMEKADAGTLWVAIQNHATTSNKYMNKAGYMVESFAQNGNTSWQVVPHDDGGYALKNIDGQYIGNAARPMTLTSDLSAATRFEPEDANADVANIASGYNSSMAVRWKVLPAKSVWINANGANATTTVQFNGGTGNWTCLFTYEVTLKYQLVYKYYYNSELVGTQNSTDLYADGAEVEITDEMIPELTGYVAQSHDASVTINGANAEVTVNCAPAATDYTVTVTGDIPDGTTFSVQGNNVTNGGVVSITGGVAETDVAVTFPTGYSNMDYEVTISGTTITIKCVEAWPVSFSSDDLIMVGSKVESVTAASSPDDNSHWYIITQTRGGESVAFARGTAERLRRGTTAQTAASFNSTSASANGAYIVRFISTGDEDLYKMQFGNGKFVNTSMYPAATNATDAAVYAFYNSNGGSGSYFGWNLNNKTGSRVDNNGAGNDLSFWESGTVSGTNGNNIWYVYEVSIVNPSSLVDVTYQILDEDNNTLFTSDPISTEIGTTITSLPSTITYDDFYDYTVTPTEVTSSTSVIQATATVKSNPLVQFTADATAPVWNYLTIRPDNSSNTSYPLYVAEGTPNVTLPSTQTTGEASQWAFIGNPYAGFTIMNRAAGTSLVLGSEVATSTNNGGDTYATLAAPGTQTCETWFITASSFATNGNGFFINNSEGQYLNRRSAANLAYWTGGHDVGSTFVATKVNEGAELYDELIAQLEAINWGTGLNQYSLVVESMDYTSQAATIISGLKTAGYTAENLTNAQLMLAGTTLNLPAAGFYRIKGNTSSTYLASGLASNNKFAMSTATDASTIFYFDGSSLSNFGSGLANGMTSDAWAWVYGDAASTVTFYDGLTNGGYAIQSGTAYFYDNGDNGSADRGGNLVINSSTNARYTSWYLEAVTELPVSISAAGQATLSLPVAWEVPMGVTVRYATREHDGLLTIEDAAETAIAADEAVILVGAEGTYNVAVATTGTALNSLLTATTPKGVSVETSTKAYILAQQGDNVGFALLADSDRNIAGFKAYYVSTAAGDAPQFLFFDEGDVTGINSVNAAAQNGAAVYDLQGRRVNGALKGVYIVNGKKVLF